MIWAGLVFIFVGFVVLLIDFIISDAHLEIYIGDIISMRWCSIIYGISL